MIQLYLKRFFKGTGSILRYFKRRLKEHSTWAGIGLAIPIASALAQPWSTVSLVCGVAMALCPDSKKAKKTKEEGE